MKHVRKIGALLLCLCFAVLMVPAAAFALDTFGYNEAVASGRVYDGTNLVSITDFQFSGVFVIDKVSADGEGILPSPNAGTYNALNATHLVLKGEDKEYYTVKYDAVYENVQLKDAVVISKAEPQIEIEAPSSVWPGNEFTLTATIVNHFDYDAGLPLAEDMSLTVDNAQRLTEVKKDGNRYSAVFAAAEGTAVDRMTASVNVLDTAQNYSPLTAPEQKTIGLRSFADYAAVDAAIAKAAGLNKGDYRDFSAVEAAVNAVVRDKESTEQAEVDAMAQAIEAAVAALEYKDADYSRVDEAIAKAEALNKDDYKDFSAVDTAVSAVVRGKNITEQEQVDAMAQAIEESLNGLEKKAPAPTKPADPSKPAAPTKPNINTNSPQTGDDSNPALWVSLFVLAGGLTGAVLYSKKRRAH
ncbi:YDG domain-containing protein [Lacrimispora sp. NSJ-141]|uniref:YDG domain-containing protein n=1 Tax=Lientehia hominis TaxID=2897778 RepID=A0AAP2RK24_9FIRM|nr:YDG domain-containing protein [Lientehia hominis]MCD2493086.1 YDG domain-containing protein [Lientehia hominis]